MTHNDPQIRFKRPKTSKSGTNQKNNYYMVCDEGKYKDDGRYKLQSIDDYDTVWSSVNYQPKPYYPSKEYE